MAKNRFKAFSGIECAMMEGGLQALLSDEDADDDLLDSERDIISRLIKEIEDNG